MIARIGCAHCKKEFGTLQYSNYYKVTHQRRPEAPQGLI